MVTIELIDDVMEQLAKRATPFGANTQGKNRMGEDELQEAIHAALTERVRCCHRELVYPSFHFMNKRRLELDLTADDFGIELKHVSCKPDGHHPSDPQGFPYDVILDCARIEVLIRDALRDDRHGRSISDGVAIGLTDHRRQWRTDDQPDWWSRCFRLPDVADDNKTWTPLPRQLLEIVRTTRRASTDGAIYVDERYHVHLADGWEYRWRDFPAEWQGRRFRYLIVRRCGEARAAPPIPSRIDLNTIVPFGSPERKLEAMRHRLGVVTRLHAERLALGANGGAEKTGRLIRKLGGEIAAIHYELERRAAA